MLTSQLLSVADDPVYLDEDPCSVDWLCVLSHRISMDTPTTAKIQSPSTLMLYFIVSQSVLMVLSVMVVLISLLR